MVRVADVDRLLAEHAIRHALVEYCRGVDRGDVDRVLAVYHEDAVDHHGTWDGLAHEDLPAALQRLLDRTRSTVHFLGPSTFTWEESTVHVETDVLALHLVPVEGGTNVEHLHGHYLDRFSCRDGDWRIAERTFVHDADYRLDRTTPAYPENLFVHSSRDHASAPPVPEQP
jgi:ketosteroid isomerase-like protein